ncbi:MAG: hypothetical protein RID09_20385 [Coleofasciculus sp. G1-WW12-02]|uniref:hypothetical protein n=1 Tax=Coleofasciculus sp. G1-WW12-02 TaxID=3068483 RepID=UPI0032F1A34A
MSNKASREEHVNWAKKRANKYIERGDLKNALRSFYSDMKKHPELKNHKYLSIGAQIILGGGLRTAEEVKEFINGFQ